MCAYCYLILFLFQSIKFKRKKNINSNLHPTKEKRKYTKPQKNTCLKILQLNLCFIFSHTENLLILFFSREKKYVELILTIANQ